MVMSKVPPLDFPQAYMVLHDASPACSFASSSSSSSILHLFLSHTNTLLPWVFVLAPSLDICLCISFSG